MQTDPEPLSTLSDEELAALAKGGESAADATELLCERYKNLVRIKARPYFLIGADREDLVQEGMIGLYKAIRDYDDGHGAAFRSFAEMCILRQIINAIKTATRQKHRPLNSYVSIYQPLYDENAERTVMDVFSLTAENPEDTIIGRETVADISKRLDAALTPLEKQVLRLYLDGMSYQDIAAKLGRGTKSVDNALQRVKAKLERFI